MDKMIDEFSVYWWDVDDNQHEEMRFVSAEVAVNRCRTLIEGPGSFVIQRVIITDIGDCTAFEWIKDKGVTFPTKEAE